MKKILLPERYEACKQYLVKIILSGTIVSFIRGTTNLVFILAAGPIYDLKMSSLREKEWIDRFFWPLFITVYLITCDLLPLIVIMGSIKPSPEKRKKKNIIVPDLAIDDQETTIEVLDLRE